MNPILQAALGSILRHVLTGAATWLVARGVWTNEDASTYVAATALALLGFGWSFFQKYRAHINILAALDLPAGSDLYDLEHRRQ